ncbi:MAG: hypothetical protein RIC55_04570 [Pirellulaceae bacterium]
MNAWILIGDKREQVQLLVDVGSLPRLTSGVQQSYAVVRVFPIVGRLHDEPINSASRRNALDCDAGNP